MIRRVVCVLSALSVAALVAAEEEGRVLPMDLPKIQPTGWVDALSDSKTMLAVLVIAPPGKCGEPCDKALDSFSKVVEKTAGLISYATANVLDTIIDEEGEEMVLATKFNITQVPTLLFYQFGPKDVDNVMRMDAQAAGQLLQSPKMFYNQLKRLMPSLVKRVSQYSVDRFLSDEGDAHLPRVLLFPSKKAPTSMLYRKMSLEFERQAVIGEAIHNDDVLAERFGVTSRPALLVSGVGPHDSSAETFSWTAYDGKFNVESLSAFLHANIPLQTPQFLDSHAMYEGHCENRGGICFIAVLPPKAEFPDVHAEFEALSREAFVKVDYGGEVPTATSQPLSFSWMHSDKQPSFMASFSRLQSPGLVALNPRKKMFATYVGTFKQGPMTSFASRVLLGGEKLDSLDALPRIAKEVAPKKKDKKKSEDGASKKSKKQKGKKKKGKKKKGKKSKSTKDEL